MNVLFLTIGRMDHIDIHAIYTDLLRCFRDKGHNVYIVCSREKRYGLPTEFVEESGVHVLRLRAGNITKCSAIEKGISTVFIEKLYKSAIKRYLANIRFDLVLYSTPPITFANVVKFVKRRDASKTYLLLKDIFPQNAVDLGMLKTRGLKGLPYRYFRNQERKLYALSDRIGCMSEANVRYVIEHNPDLDPDAIEVCPNCIEVRDVSITEDAKLNIKLKYGLPIDKKIFVYGGNLGKPQGVPFIIDCLKRCEAIKEAFFFIVGSGTEYKKLETYVTHEKPRNVKLMESIAKDEFDHMIAACDAGLVFLDHRFTIPNFPSRILSYMQAGLPIIAATDKSTDVGKVIIDGGFGWWCESNDVDKFVELVRYALTEDLESVGEKGLQYLRTEYEAEKAYEIIMKGVGEQLGVTSKTPVFQ